MIFREELGQIPQQSATESVQLGKKNYAQHYSINRTENNKKIRQDKAPSGEKLIFMNEAALKNRKDTDINSDNQSKISSSQLLAYKKEVDLNQGNLNQRKLSLVYNSQPNLSSNNANNANIEVASHQNVPNFQENRIENMEIDIQNLKQTVSNIPIELRGEFSSQINNLSRQFSNKLDIQTSQFSNKLDNQSREFSKKLENQSTEFSSQINNLTTLVLESHTKLSQQIEKLQKQE